jgi:uncharacterized Ntn-hydrolase superfamily protein
VTFSLVACDLEARQWGVAVASKFLAVGSVVPWARAEVGAVATQAYANVAFGPEGLELLAAGAGAQEAVDRLLAADDGREDRQVGIVDADGRGATYTGSRCMHWAGGRTGPGYAAQGNILTGPEVVDRMTEAFEATAGPLADRLVAALLAGDRAGGDRRGRQSAAVQVHQHGGGYGGTNDIVLDLRVDDHADPVVELGRLRTIHETLFGKTPPDRFLPLDGELAEEVGRLLADRGHGGEDLAASLDRWAGVENLEERLDPHGRSIDPVVLDALRRRA